MRVKRSAFLIGGLLALAATLLVMTFLPDRRTERSAGTESRARSSSAEKEKRATAEARPKADAIARGHRVAEAARRRAADRSEAIHTEASAVAKGAAAAERKPDAESREKAVAAWGSLVERLAETTEAPSDEAAEQVKKAFDALDKDDQMDGIRQSLNLFQDEQFPVLYGILFDKEEDAEVLDAIFSDALNRSEDIKNPLMKELVKDKTHPCFFESARILDVVGQGND